MTVLAPTAAPASCSDSVVHSEGNAVMDVVAQAGDEGITMGAIVEILERAGHPPESVEMGIWDLLEAGKIVPSGFVCRILRRRDGSGALTDFRSYEFVLVKSPDQMELPIP